MVPYMLYYDHQGLLFRTKSTMEENVVPCPALWSFNLIEIPALLLMNTYDKSYAIMQGLSAIYLQVTCLGLDNLRSVASI
jgi:hypothetical protein